ncbi:transporter [Actinocatenispora rupis]|uniref:Transporter n=1 Tax=Actinocatenispora rupis TaxID=519421 RepID=A0A8J3J902_9ACTN|nr:transporter [Actinocatenispora rupis]
MPRAATMLPVRPPRWVPGFLLVAVIWGASFTFIKLAVDGGVAPPWLALIRCALGAGTLVAICLLRRETIPRDPRTWLHGLLVALLLHTVPFTLVAYGETHVSSVFAGLCNAVTPLATLLFAVALVPAERLTGRRLGGIGVGLAGVFVLIGAWRGLPAGTLGGSLACVASTLCYGAGFAYTRRYFAHRATSAAGLSAVQMCCATAELAFVAPVGAGAPHWPGWTAATALLVLGAFGTGVAYIINLNVIRTAGATVAATVTYLTPVASTLLGALLLGEALRWNHLAGGVLILGGVVLVQLASRHAPAFRPVAAADRPRVASSDG